MAKETDITKSEKSKTKWADYYLEATTSLTAMMTEFTTDFKYYLGDQWDAALYKAITNRGDPALVFNYVKKQVDVVSGAQRQNVTDLAAFPIDGGDVMVADVFTKVMKWVLAERNSKLTLSSVFKDSVICGLGWLMVRMAYDRDPKYGNIVFEKVASTDSYPDPHFTKIDLSDAHYYIRKKQLSKDVSKMLWPHKSTEIDALKSENVDDGTSKRPSISNERGETLNVVEYWYKEYKRVKTIINLDDPADIADWEGDEIEDFKRQVTESYPDTKLDDMTDDQLLELVLSLNPRLDVEMREQTKVKLRIEIEDTVEVYDGENPYEIDEFNFIPWFAFYESSFDDWSYKVQGIVRSLRDPQDERNKRRSNMMQQILSMPTSGWSVEEGSVDEAEDYRNSAGAGAYLTYRRGFQKPEQINPTQLSQGLVVLDQLAEADFNRIGPNADVLGQMSQGGEPGIVVQLRQKQGMQALQEIFDNHSAAMITLGRILLKLISQWPSEKIKRILGDDIPFFMNETQKEKNLEQVSQLEGLLAGLMEQADVPEVAQQIQQVSEQIKQMTQAEVERQTMEDDFWKKYDKMRKTARFDVKVDEIVNSPTARMSTKIQLTELQQYGKDVPMEMHLEYSEMDINAKQKFLQIEEQNRQMQQQAVQAEQQKNDIQSKLNQDNVQLENRKIEMELAKIQVEATQDAREHELKMAKVQLEMEKIKEKPPKPKKTLTKK